MKSVFMQRAIELSLEHMEKGEGGPFGAVIVKNGKIIGEGWNQVTSTCDPTAHAEIVAIRHACKESENFSLEGAEIYTSCEPCPMCLTAILWARIGKIYYANTRQDAAAIGFDDQFFYDEVAKPLEKRSLPTVQIMRQEALGSFQAWAKKADKIRY